MIDKNYQKKLTLFKSLRLLFGRIFSRQIHFSKIYVGKIFTMQDQKQFIVFRDLKVEPEKNEEKFKTVFKVRFKFSGLPLSVNKRLSMMPAPFLLANPGFCQKIWSVSKEGYFQGLYQWATKEYAETYPNSFIFKLMTKRAAKGTVSFEVIPDTLLSEYVETLLN